MSRPRPGGLSMGTTALLLACFAASVLVSIVLDVLAAVANMIAAEYGGAEASGGALELMSMIGRPGFMAFLGLGLWIGIVLYARRAVREEGQSRQSTAAQVVLICAPVLGVVVALGLYMLGLPWALDLEAS